MNEEEAKAEADRIEAALQKLAEAKQARDQEGAAPQPEFERLKEATRREWALSPVDRVEYLKLLGRTEEAAQLEGTLAKQSEPVPMKLLGERSRAPMPLEPLRSDGCIRQTAPHRQPPRWPLWLALPRVELWQAVLLSLEIEPSDALKGEACGMAPDRPSPIHRLPREFFARRADCMRALGIEGPIRPQGPLYSGMLQSPRCAVLLEEVAAFLTLVGNSVPPEMQAATADAKAKPETKEQRQDRRLKLSEDSSLSFSEMKFDREGKLQGRLPDGVGAVALTEGVTRQAFTDDLKAALERREALRRAGCR